MAIYLTDASVPAEWEMGDVILDRYEVEGKLGQGGFGTVYKVLHYDFEVELAVKCPKPERFESEKDKQNFIREATNWVELGLHPHIVACHYVRTIGGIPRVFAEYVAGGTLHDWIRTRKLYEGGHKVALERILDIAIQTAWGLHYAHQRGLVHQDIKPANVMMTPDGVAKVTDFGLAKARVLATESILVTQMGQTLAYYSPEQGRGERLGRKTDIWSWAVSVLEMFMGNVTWGAGPSAKAALEEDYLADGPQGKDAALLPPMPQEVIELLRHCFQRKTSKRPKNMSRVANRLLAIFQKEMGYNYLHFRPFPEAITDPPADNLNNRAVSLMELGKVQEAQELWKKAIEVCPQHIEATFNLEVSRWRGGEQDEVLLVPRLQDVCHSFKDQWLPKYLLALVHFERADTDVAIELLEAANEQSPDNFDLHAALKLAHSGTLPHACCLRTLTGHTWSVTSVAVSNDGKLALSGSDDDTLKLWEIETGTCLRTLTGHTDIVFSVAFSPDGKLALSGSKDKTLKLWEIETGTCLRTLTGHTDRVSSVAFSPDGKRALSGSGDGTLKLWEVASGSLLNTLTEHTWHVSSVAFSPDGKLALSSSWDETLKLWEVESGRCINTLVHTSFVNSAVFSPDGKLALTGSSDGTLKLWEVASGRLLNTLTGHTKKVNSVAFSPDGKLALSGSSDGSDGSDRTLKLWEVASGRLLNTLTGHKKSVTSIVFSPDGKLALSGSSDGTLKLWEVQSEAWNEQYTYRLAQLWSYGAWFDVQEKIERLQQEAQQHLSREAFGMAHLLLRQARQLLGSQPTAKLLSTWQQLSSLSPKVGLQAAWLMHTLTGHTSSVNSVVFSPDGKLALSGSSDKTLKLWEVESGRCINTLVHTSFVNSAVFSPDGKLALTGSDDKTLKQWEVASGNLLRIVTWHTKYLNSAAFSLDGKLALSGSHGTIELWEVASGRLLNTLMGHTEWVNAVAFSPNGKLALSGSGHYRNDNDNKMKVWEVQSGRLLNTFTGHTNIVTSVAFSPDGKLALSGSQDKTLKVWEVASGSLLNTLTGHTFWVTSVAFSPDGKYALSGFDDGTLKLWDIETGSCLRTLTGHTSGVFSVAFSPDGRYALSGSDDGTLKVWALDWELEAQEVADWDEGARVYLENFMTRQTPYAGTLPQDREPTEEEIRLALTRRGEPRWTEEEFQRLIRELQGTGYGWLREEGVRARLMRMKIRR